MPMHTSAGPLGARPGRADLPAAHAVQRPARPSFIPDQEFRVIRLHPPTAGSVDERTRKKNRAEKLLESSAARLSSVIADLHMAAGWDGGNTWVTKAATPRCTVPAMARTRATFSATAAEAGDQDGYPPHNRDDCRSREYRQHRQVDQAEHQGIDGQQDDRENRPASIGAQ